MADKTVKDGWSIISRYQNTKSMFVITYSQGSICYDDAVGSSESLFNPAREIYTLFN